MNGILSLLTPLLLHMAVSDGAAILFGGKLDSAWCTTIAAVLVLPVASVMYWNDQKKRNKIRAGSTAWEKKHLIPALIGCFAAGGVLNVAWSGIMNLLHITEMFSNEAQEGLLASRFLAQMIGLGGLVPAAEEMIFRGLIYSRMKQMFPVKWAIFFSALLFAVYHGNPIQMIFAFPMAIALALVYEQGKLFCFPLAFHMGANLTAVMVNML